MKEEKMHRMILLLLLAMSIISFVTFGIDKWKAIHQKWRIPEATLLLLAFIFGGPGALAGMIIFHHKTRKWKFRILVPLFTVVEIMAVVYFLRIAPASL